MATPPVTNGLNGKHDGRDLSATDGDPVDPWPDTSGEGDNLTTINPQGPQVFEAPTYVENAMPNGAPGVEFTSDGPSSGASFDGSFLRWPDTGGIVDERSCTILVYAAYNNPGGEFVNWIAGAPKSDWQTLRLMHDYANAEDEVTRGGTNGGWTEAAPGEFQALAIRCDGDQVTGWENGVQQVSITDTTPDNTPGRYGVGGLWNGGSTEGALWAPGSVSPQAPVGIILRYNRPLSDPEMVDVMDWMVSEMESGGADTTPPSLSGPTASKNGTSGYSGTVNMDETGTLDHVVTTASTKPTGPEVANGNDHTGSPAPASGSSSVTSTGEQTVGQTGVLSADTQYWVHYAGTDAADNQSSVVTGGPFTTDAAQAGDGLPPSRHALQMGM